MKTFNRYYSEVGTEVYAALSQVICIMREQAIKIYVLVLLFLPVNKTHLYLGFTYRGKNTSIESTSSGLRVLTVALLDPVS